MQVLRESRCNSFTPATFILHIPYRVKNLRPRRHDDKLPARHPRQPLARLCTPRPPAHQRCVRGKTSPIQALPARALSLTDAFQDETAWLALDQRGRNKIVKT